MKTDDENRRPVGDDAVNAAFLGENPADAIMITSIVSAMLATCEDKPALVVVVSLLAMLLAFASTMSEDRSYIVKQLRAKLALIESMGGLDVDAAGAILRTEAALLQQLRDLQALPPGQAH
jgi:hypothetical protein